MTEIEFATWVGRHAVLFFMQAPGDPALFAAWQPILAARYSLDELSAASTWLASRDPVVFRPNMLAKLLAVVEDNRTKNRERLDREKIGTCSFCELCGGFGFVSVPHPDSIRLGQWEPLGGVYYTSVVVCCCEKGKRIALAERIALDNAADEKRHRLPVRRLTLERYEENNPDWRGQLEDRQAVQALRINEGRVAHEAQKQAEKTKGAKRGK